MTVLHYNALLCSALLMDGRWSFPPLSSLRFTEKALADETKLITELPYSDRQAHVTQFGFESGKPDVIGSGNTVDVSLQQN
jgi:hypothetical protein